MLGQNSSNALAAMHPAKTPRHAQDCIVRIHFTGSGPTIREETTANNSHATGDRQVPNCRSQFGLQT